VQRFINEPHEQVQSFLVGARDELQVQNALKA